MTDTSTNIAHRINKLPMTKTVWKVLFISGIGWLFDAMDQGMISGVIAAIGNEWVLSAAQKGLLGSAGVLGMILGAALSGLIADRVGRRTVIVSTLLIFSLGSALSGFAFSYGTLLICRFITGFGLGGELPAASTLVSEFSPVKHRGRNVVILESFWAWGWIVAMLIAYLAIPVLGWRAAFFFGAVPALFAAVLRFALPESPRYLAQSGRLEEADTLVSKMEREASSSGSGEVAGHAESAIPSSTRGAPASGDTSSSARGNSPSYKRSTPAATPPPVDMTHAFTSLWSRAHVRATCVVWILWFGINFGYYGFVLWTPTLLGDQGFDLSKSLMFALVMSFAQLPGYLAAALLIERLGRKPVLTIFFAGTALAAWLFGHASGTAEILGFGCLLYFFALGAWGCVYSYTPELYPTAVRGAGVGWAAAFGRIGALIAPMIVPVIYSFCGPESGFAVVFIVLTVVLAVVALIVAIFGVETKGKILS